MSLAVRPPVAPMLARLVRELPAGTWHFEPKWDGFRALAFRDGGDVDLRSRHDRRFARYFPEVAEAVRALDVDVALDGELVVVREGRLDFAALMARLHPARSRVERLAREMPASFIAFDLLAIGDRDLRRAPFHERRAALESLLRRPSAIWTTPATDDPAVARGWLGRFRGNGVDGVVAKEPASVYQPGRRAMVKVKREETLDCVVAGLRFLADRPAVGSLLLGLHDGDRLLHVGVASQFSDADRRALVDALRGLAVPIAGHPWERGFGLERSPLGRLSGAAGRWTPGEMALDWIPLRPVRVCEVACGPFDARRLRHPARFVRWRPDREPCSCTFAQLEIGAADVGALLAG